MTIKNYFQMTKRKLTKSVLFFQNIGNKERNRRLHYDVLKLI